MGIVSIVTFLVWFKQEQKAETVADATTLSEAIQLVSRVEGYEDYHQYIDNLVKRAHAQAFENAYGRGSPGNRWDPSTSASFSKDKYLQFLFMKMRREIHEDIPDVAVPTGNDYREIQRELETLREELGIKSLSGR